MTDQTLEGCEYLPWDQHPEHPLNTTECYWWFNGICPKIQEGKKCTKPWLNQRRDIKDDLDKTIADIYKWAMENV